MVNHWGVDGVDGVVDWGKPHRGRSRPCRQERACKQRELGHRRGQRGRREQQRGQRGRRELQQGRRRRGGQRGGRRGGQLGGRRGGRGRGQRVQGGGHEKHGWKGQHLRG